MDCVTLSDLRFETIVGILPEERVTPQPVVLDVRLDLPLGPVGDTGDLGLGIDYAKVETELTALAQLGQFWLIESLGLAAARWLLLESSVQRVRIAIRKPEILGGRAVPGVVVERESPPHVTVEVHGGIERTTLVDTPRDGAWRLRMEPDTHGVLDEHHAALVVDGEILVGGQRYEAGTRVPVGAEISCSSGATLLVAGAG